MSRKKTSACTGGDEQALLNPSVFLSSIVKMGIIPHITTPPPRNSSNKRQKTTKGGSIVKRDLEKGEEETEVIITATLPEAATVGESTNIVFSNEAIEVLRKCHGEFIALVASELVIAGKDRKEKLSTTKGQKKRKEPGAAAVDGNSPISKRQQSSNRMQVVTPKSVLQALENLDFEDIVCHLKAIEQKKQESKKDTIDHRASHQMEQDVGVKKNVHLESEEIHGTSSKSATVRNNPMDIAKESNDENIEKVVSPTSSSSSTTRTKRQRAKNEKKKFQKALKNKKATADLLKEQERLFASSAAKMKMDK